jgi:serine/threonine-protein kinase
MGIVFEAFDRSEGRLVAIKLLRDADTLSPRAIGRMLREARLTAALRSEHAVRLFQSGRLRDGAPYLVMERLTGADLASRLRSGVLALADKVDVVVQACDAIGEAHDLGIVHRDLKPSNVFLEDLDGSGWRAKVLDFGLAREMTGQAEMGHASLTESGGILGSPSYMAPEQVRALAALDGRVDLWALGVILFEALCGFQPFRGASVADTWVRIVSERQPWLHRVSPGVPEGLAAVVDMCLEKERERRPKSAVALARALAPYASDRCSAVLAKAWCHDSVEVGSCGTTRVEYPVEGRSTAPVMHDDIRSDMRSRAVRMAKATLALAGTAAAVWAMSTWHARASDTAKVASAAMQPVAVLPQEQLYANIPVQALSSSASELIQEVSPSVAAPRAPPRPLRTRSLSQAVHAIAPVSAAAPDGGDSTNDAGAAEPQADGLRLDLRP